MVPDPTGVLHFEIEGTAGDTPTFEERIGIVLRSAQEEGYGFVGETRPASARSRPRTPAKWRWVELQPVGQNFEHAPDRHLGFSVSANGSHMEAPAFTPAIGGVIVASPLELLASQPGVRRVEIEFTGRDLNDADVQGVTRLLNHVLPEIERSLPPETPPLPLRSYLALCLLQKAGWDIRCRIALATRARIPKAAMEICGLQTFGTKCTIVEHTSGVRTTRNPNAGRSLLPFYPLGWTRLPPILPNGERDSALDAAKLLNRTLPRLPESGLCIGEAGGRAVRLPPGTRDRHTYVLGSTGTGKSTLLFRMILADMLAGEPVILIDPHGDLYRDVLAAVPAARRNDLFLIDPSSPKQLPGFNLLDLPPGPLRRRHADFLVGEMLRFFEETYDMRTCGGPMFELFFRNTLLLMCLYQPPALKPALAESDHPRDRLIPTLNAPPQQCRRRKLSLGDLGLVMTDSELRAKLVRYCTDPGVCHFWTDIAPKTSGDSRYENFVPYITSKVNALTQSEFVSQLFCSERNEVRIADRMNRNQIILVNLDKGRIGAHECCLVGRMIMMEIFAAGLGRSARRAASRTPVNVYVDEFQHFVSDNSAAMLSEARKFGLRLTLANQNLSQLRRTHGTQDLLESVLGNVGNLILFRMGVPDSRRFEDFTHPFTARQMQELPNYHALVRLLTPIGPIRPFAMRTLAHDEPDPRPTVAMR